MLNDLPLPAQDALREQMRRDWLADDESILRPLLPLADVGEQKRGEAQAYAQVLVEKLRQEQQGKGGVDALLNEFSLSTDEGVALMCLAEALLRVPDAHTADELIRDKLQGGDWSVHLGRSDSTFVNASAWALLFTGKMVNYSDRQQRELHGSLKRAAGRMGQPVIRAAVRRAMAIMGDVFVMGRSIQGAMDRARGQETRGYRYSYDMLGEGARTQAAADAYYQAYLDAIDALGQRQGGKGPQQTAGISVKLSALHPRYEAVQHSRVMAELVPKVKALALKAREYDIGMTIDAEEADRLDLSLDVIEAVFRDPDLRGWSGFGVAVQAYLKRGPQVIDWLENLATEVGRQIMVRLVKGAYWDSEIKRAQQEGLAGYPVFVRKAATDVCYQACARKLLDARPKLYPQFATHNAWAVAAILAMDKTGEAYEFQRLHGMGEALYAQVMADRGVPCRIYAPVGEHEDLLAYLVRRLLENGANSSFVNNIVDAHVSIEQLVADPLLAVRQWEDFSNPAIPLPRALYGDERANSRGMDLSDGLALGEVREGMQQALAALRDTASTAQGDWSIVNPARHEELLGSLGLPDQAQMLDALARADACFREQDWPLDQRYAFLLELADALERHRDELLMLCVREAGKTMGDAVAEIREAVDFCRYYAVQAKAASEGEARGVVLCISPWNFPLAIFLGQVTAALAAGNVVLAKPAEQTSLIALRAWELMRECGLPADRVQLLFGPGQAVGECLVADRRIAAVMFTGSTATGRWLFERLLQRDDAPVPLIAETGGQNVMLVDSTALPEQVVDDVISSGFQSAGQRCSALRVLLLQEDVADPLIDMIKGAMDQLQVGDPAVLASDIGPVIDQAALDRLRIHCRRMAREPRARLLHRLELSPELAAQGHFFTPHLYEIDTLDVLDQEVFGPIVHVLRYRAEDLDQMLEAINASGFGLTLGVHSRVQRSADRIAAAAQVGNIYVNRNMIGAVVGVQPFGGRGLSGTGPKAGGPLYLKRLQIPVEGELEYPPTGEARILPGPTGERNVYMLEPRGQVHAYYTEDDDLEHCRKTVDAALNTGNQVIVHAPLVWETELSNRRRYWISKGGDEQALQLRFGNRPDLVDGHGTIVVQPGSSLQSGLLKELAGRHGPLPNVVCEVPGPGYAWRFVLEKVISTDTTAAGGNASLMTLQN